jgi:hypothetical protein
VALLGGVTVDLGMAQLEASESVITVVAILDGAGIIAPPGVTIQLSGVSLFGGKGDKRAAGRHYLALRSPAFAPSQSLAVSP